MHGADLGKATAAVCAALATSGPDDRTILTSVVDTARAVFDATASSVFLRSADGKFLTFEAVSGEGSDTLVGKVFPADRGIAGWVASTGEPLIVEETHANAHFAADFAAETGYVPNVIMAVPIAYLDDVLGVLEVLDPRQSRPGIADLDLLSLLAAQAAVALQALIRQRAARSALSGVGARYADVIGLVNVVEQMDRSHQETGLTLVRMLRELLEG